MSALRWFLLVLFAGLLIGSTAIQIGLQVVGNESIKAQPGDLWWVAWLPLAISAVLCLIEFGLGLIIIAGRQLLRDRYAGVAIPACVALAMLFGVNWFFVRSGFESTAHRDDRVPASNAHLVAWHATEERLVAAARDAESLPPIVVDHQRLMLQARNEIASMTQLANDLDNDGRRDNDHLIPGLLAKIESLKADLPNYEATFRDLRAEHAEAIAVARSRLDAHRATNGIALAAMAEAEADRGQFARFGDDLAQMVPGIDADSASNWAMSLLALVVLLANHFCSIGLKTFFVSGQAVAAAVEASNVVVGEFSPEKQVMGIYEARKEARRLLSTGVIPPGVTTSSIISRMPAKDLNALLSDYTGPSFGRRQRAA